MSSPPNVRRTKVVGTAKRLAIREYVPLGSWILSWFMIGLAVGHADVVRLLAANAFVQVIRNLCTVRSDAGAWTSCGAEDGVFKAARRVALRIEAEVADRPVLAATALLCFILSGRGLQEAAAMVAIAALRNSRAQSGRASRGTARADCDVSTWLRRDVRRSGADWFCCSDCTGPPPPQFSRSGSGVDWSRQCSLAPRRERPGHVWTDPLTFAEAARRTEGSARQKLSYRLISSLASLLLGPLRQFRRAHQP